MSEADRPVPPENARPPRRRRWRRVVGWVLLALVAAAILVRTIAGFVTQRALDSRLDALAAAGEPILITEMAPPDLPPERNAAELYAQAVALLGDRLSKSRQRVSGLSKNRPLTEPEIEEARALVGQFAESLRLIREGSERPECCFPVRYGTRPAGAIALPQLTHVQDAERLLGLSCRVNLADGRADAAAADCLAILRVARATENEPILISMLVEIAGVGLFARHVEELLERAEPSAAALARFPSPRSDAQARERFVRAMRGERCIGADAFQNILDGNYQDFVRDDEAPSPGMPAVRRPLSSTVRPLFVADFSYYLDIMGRLIDAAGRPGRDGRERWNSAVDVVNAERARFVLFHMISGFLLPSLTKADKAFAGGCARERVALTGIALRRFRIDRGEYPDSLAALVPQYLAAVPTDPFTDADLIYRRDGKGFVLYSVGPDGKDDGGLDSGKRDEGDIAWHVSR